MPDTQKIKEATKTGIVHCSSGLGGMYGGLDTGADLVEETKGFVEAEIPTHIMLLWAANHSTALRQKKRGACSRWRHKLAVGVW